MVLAIVEGTHNDDDTCDGTELLDQSSTSFGTVVTLTCTETFSYDEPNMHHTFSKPAIVVDNYNVNEKVNHITNTNDYCNNINNVHDDGYGDDSNNNDDC